MKSKPIIVFATSETPNWVPEDCPNPPTKTTITTSDAERLQLYDAAVDIKKIALTNRHDMATRFNPIEMMSESYKASGMLSCTSHI